MEISTSDIPFAFKTLTTKKLSSYAFFRVPFMTALFYEVILEIFFFFFFELLQITHLRLELFSPFHLPLGKHFLDENKYKKLGFEIFTKMDEH